MTAVIYTHSHIDHFGGVLGVVDADTDVPIVAPEHFLEHAVSENVYAGGAMLRRGMYHTGSPACRSARPARSGSGSGPAASDRHRRADRADPRHHPHRPGRDARRRAHRLPDDAGHRGAGRDELPLPGPPRAVHGRERHPQPAQPAHPARRARSATPRIWSRYLAEAIELFADDTDVAFASHHWPTWGTENIVQLPHRAARPVRLPARPDAAADEPGPTSAARSPRTFELPPALDAAWHTHGYYGSVSHNVKAIYQRYLGWYDGNPAHLWQHPPEAAAARYVEAIGGVDATVAKAQEFADDGDLRFAAELASHAVFADPDHDAAKELLADVLTRLGYGAENATWRNCYLTGAQELRAATSHATGQLGRAWRPP